MGLGEGNICTNEKKPLSFPSNLLFHSVGWSIAPTALVPTGAMRKIQLLEVHICGWQNSIHCKSHPATTRLKQEGSLANLADQWSSSESLRPGSISAKALVCCLFWFGVFGGLLFWGFFAQFFPGSFPSDVYFKGRQAGILLVLWPDPKLEQVTPYPRPQPPAQLCWSLSPQASPQVSPQKQQHWGTLSLEMVSAPPAPEVLNCPFPAIACISHPKSWGAKHLFSLQGV